MGREAINMFWHGSLSNYELASINSFICQGHPVNVYSYHDLSLPDGAILQDASQILSKSIANEYFKQTNPPLSTLANVFRYKLLEQRGGIWMDSDFICLQPIVITEENWVCKQEETIVNNAAMRLNKSHPLATSLYLQSRAMGSNPQKSGPHLLTKLIKDYPEVLVFDSPSFYPIHWTNASDFIDPNGLKKNITDQTFAVHWWGEIFQKIGIPKNILPPKNSWLRQYVSSVENIEECDHYVVQTWIENYNSAKTFSQIENKILWQWNKRDNPFFFLLNMGEFWAKNNYLEQSIACLTLALKIYPKSVQAKLLLAEIYLKQDNLAQANAMIDDLSITTLNNDQQQYLQKIMSYADFVGEV